MPAGAHRGGRAHRPGSRRRRGSSRTARSARSRSPCCWRRIPRSCCWTSRWPGWRRGTSRPHRDHPRSAPGPRLHRDDGRAPHGRRAGPRRPGRRDAPRQPARPGHPGGRDGGPDRAECLPWRARMTAAAEARSIRRIEGLERPSSPDSRSCEDVSFSVPATGVTALLGRNGVGKTSTIKAILGLIDRTGAVRARRRADRAGSRRQRSSAAASATCPRTARCSAKLTVAENLRLAERDDAPRRQLVERALPRPAAPGRAQMAGHALRRPAADGVAGPRAAERQQTAARRRTHQGPCPEDRRRGRRDPRRSRRRPFRSCSSSRTCTSSASSPKRAVVLSGGRVVHTGSAARTARRRRADPALLGRRRRRRPRRGRQPAKKQPGKSPGKAPTL